MTQMLRSGGVISALLILAILFLAITSLASGALADLVWRWWEDEAYSHGPIMLVLAAWLCLRNYHRSSNIVPQWSYVGIGVAIFAIALVAIGEIAEVRTLTQYALLLALFAIAWSTLGWRKASNLLLVPITLVLFVIPLPYYLQVELTSTLQLWSSQLGAAGVRLLGIPVFLEGNIIDLGIYRIQVVEACSGLNYLYPLLGIAFILGYISERPIVRTALLMGIAIPITILMNGLRIVLVALLVRNSGVEAATGFLHEFQGLLVFSACILLLLLINVVVGWFLGSTGLRSSLFAEADPSATAEYRITPSFIASGFVLLCFIGFGGFAKFYYSDRVAIEPPRQEFAFFPSNLGTWRGTRAALSPAALSLLKPTDYLLMNLRRASSEPAVEFYSAYYSSQLGGTAIHSPKVCLPGGGWEILNIDQVALKEGEGLPNRAVLQSDRGTMLVYYWFQLRGRITNSEYEAKWLNMKDSILSSRSDGALVRLATVLDLESDDPMGQADQRIRSVADGIWPKLAAYVPGRLESQASNNGVSL